MQVSVRELKAHLSAYLRKVERGERIVITSHGKPVGQLIAPARQADEEDMLAAMLNLPNVQPGQGGQIKGARKPIATQPDENLSEELLEH
jgi:prevent-host-death family protein